MGGDMRGDTGSQRGVSELSSFYFFLSTVFIIRVKERPPFSFQNDTSLLRISYPGVLIDSHYRYSPFECHSSFSLLLGMTSSPIASIYPDCGNSSLLRP